MNDYRGWIRAMQTTKKIRPDRWLALGFALLMLSAVGCVEQRFIIITEPDGAIAWDYRNRPLSATPADMPFTYYGKYLFTLSKEGYETKVVEEQVRAPWYMLPGLDFVSENVLPWTIRDVRTFHYTLTPLQTMSLEDILFGEHGPCRTRAEGIGNRDRPRRRRQTSLRCRRRFPRRVRHRSPSQRRRFSTCNRHTECRLVQGPITSPKGTAGCGGSVCGENNEE